MSSFMLIECIACGSDDMWEGKEEVWRLTGEEGTSPVKILLYACECGSVQSIKLEE
tara:strand:+ start:16834 stop:17001 length:168 start_codon:yes stop_codon:yes gene_type:complete